ncbi:MAG: META domain-containing protein [Acidimicrobiia bacterium]
MKLKSAVLIAVVTIVLAACGSNEPLGPPAGLDGSWQLTSGTHQGTAIEPISTHPVTMSFDGAEVTGTAACNGYGGTFDITDSEISFSEMSRTEMACSPTEVMDLEESFLAALLSVTEVMVTDGLLVLSGETTTLEFEALPPVPTADLLGTVWVLDGLVSGDSVSSVAGDRATLELFSDGSLLGSTGCRTLTGTYVESAGSIETPTLAADGECPDDLFDQDSQVISVLGGPFQAQVDGRSMTLTRSGGEGLTYRAEG